LELTLEDLRAVNAKYGIVAIGRNEQLGVRKCLESLKNQTLKPERIIFVNDGSTDKTKEIAQSIPGVEVIEFGEEHETWLDSPKLAKVVNKGIYEIGKMQGVNFIITMGGDTILPSNYAEFIINKMVKHPEVVVASGKIEGEFSYAPRGSARVTNLNYWKRIGIGYKIRPGFEGYHLNKAVSIGLSYRVFNIKITSSKKTGEQYSNKHWFNEGFAAKALGYTPSYLYGKSIKLCFTKGPRAGSNLIYGYMKNKDDLYEKELRDHVRQTQINLVKYRKKELITRLTNGKKISKEKITILLSGLLLFAGVLVSSYVSEFIQSNWNIIYGYYSFGIICLVVAISTYWYLHVPKKPNTGSFT